MATKLRRAKQKIGDWRKEYIACKAERRRLLKIMANAVPRTWLDSMLTGPDAVIGSPPYGCPDIEKVCKAIKKRLDAASRTP